jgi:beta-galactosidase/beta-glucuronidase
MAEHCLAGLVTVELRISSHFLLHELPSILYLTSHLHAVHALFRRYPRDPDFLQNVAAEVTQQVQRLSWHPSVGVWAGNNEIEGSLGWYSESRTNKQLFAGDYIALFVDTIRNVIKKVR